MTAALTVSLPRSIPVYILEGVRDRGANRTAAAVNACIQGMFAVCECCGGCFPVSAQMLQTQNEIRTSDIHSVIFCERRSCGFLRGLIN